MRSGYVKISANAIWTSPDHKEIVPNFDKIKSRV
jgi:hypothetical protein